MSGKPIDRRIQRTRQLLRNSLIQLVEEKGYSAISIQDLADHANLGKATFYLHYKDKEELLYECMEIVLSELREQISALPPTRWSSNDPRPVQLTFEFVQKNAKFVKTMMHDPGGLIFFQRLKTMVTDLVMESIVADIHLLQSEPLVPLAFISAYFGGALLSTIEWWVENDMDYDINEMVEMISKAAIYDRHEILGITQP